MKFIKKHYKIFLITAAFLFVSLSILNGIKNIYAGHVVRNEIYVPIIMYHHVKYADLGKDVISPYEFQSDLDYLVANNYTTITMEDLIDYVYNSKELPPNPIILSFDDGYLSTYKNVFPLLKEYDMKIVLSVIGKSIDDFSQVDDEDVDYSHITWNQLYEMEESGHVEIQNHTYNLHKIYNGRYGCSQMANEPFTQYESVIENDVITLQEKIESVIHKEPNTFTYPYGKYNENTSLILKNMGFKATLTVTYGINVIHQGDPDSLYDLKRICRSHTQGLNKLINEAMETIK